MKTHGPVLLARYLALAWIVLIVYASLHPFSGWRDTGISPFSFLEGGWPRYWTVFDLVVNVAAYVPLGFLLTLAMSRLPGRVTAALLAVCLAAVLSLSMETIQNWIPTRVPSNVDWACNSLGGLIGALLAGTTGPRFFPHLIRWQQHLVAPLPHAELGLTLLGLWLFIPLSPEILLFGAGDLRTLLELPGAMPFNAENFTRIETAVVACNALAVGLLVGLLAASRRLSYVLAGVILIIGLWVRTMAAALLVAPEQAFTWWTPGVQSGLLFGIGALVVALLLPSGLRLMLAAMALMAGTVLVNIAPHNPYSLAALAVWKQGHFLNFNGFTRLVSIVWPFLTLPFLMVSSRQR